MRARTGPRRNARGQAYTEYAIVTMAIVLALLARDETGRPYLGRLIDVVQRSWQGYAVSIALPELPVSPVSPAK